MADPDDLTRPPTIAEMRRVARYLGETLQLHSAAGKLLAKADYLDRVVDALMKYTPEDKDNG